MVVELLLGVVVLTLLYSVASNHTCLVVALYSPREVYRVDTVVGVVLDTVVYLSEDLNTRVAILQSSLDALVLPVGVVARISSVDRQTVAHEE